MRTSHPNLHVTGRAGWLPAVRGGWRKGVRHEDRNYLPLTREDIRAHLSGETHIGLYPLLDGDLCSWLAADFDGQTAMLDALAYLKAARLGQCRQHWKCHGRASARIRGVLDYSSTGGDCALRANSPSCQDLPEDQIQQSYRHDRRSCPTTPVQRCRSHRGG